MATQERRRLGLDCAAMSPPFTPLRNFYTVDEVRNLSLLLLFLCTREQVNTHVGEHTLGHDSISLAIFS